MLSAQVYDVIDATRARLAEHRPDSAAAVRQLPALLGFSPVMQASSRQLKRFLLRQLYRHPQVVETTERAQRVVRELFAAYVAEPALMPADYAAAPDPQRAVCDYIAGMTDRYAIGEHARITGVQLFEPSAHAAGTGRKPSTDR